MDQCPDNSTACLIAKVIELNQQILDGINETNNSFNWDPASFIVTLAIGVLAFIVACLTVFQGILAAGPGRVKAGKTAIGPWSKKSKTTFSWEELGVRSSAVVPVIEINRWNTNDRVWGILPEHSDEADLTDFIEHGATWVNLLSSLGMTNVQWMNYKTIGTDYLPADIQGPPVTVHMKSLITLAAIADDYCSINVADHARFVTMTGLYTSISIREHPVLGTVAAFEMHGTPRTALPYIFMHPSGGSMSNRKSSMVGYRTFKTSAFDITSSYALGEGYLSTAFGMYNLAECSTTNLEMDIRCVKAGFLHQVDGQEEWRSDNPTIFSALITGNIPSRPRMVPKTVLKLKDVARQLVSRSMWRMETSFPIHFERLLGEYHPYITYDPNLHTTPEIWDSYMTTPFDHRWSRLLAQQRQCVARDSHLRWTNFATGASGYPHPSFVPTGDSFAMPADSYIKAVSLKRFIDRLCSDEAWEIEGESRIKFMFTGLDIAALQVGFQAEVLLLDYYLLNQDREELACALMILLKDISLGVQPSQTPKGDYPPRLPDEWPYQSVGIPREPKGPMISTINDISYTEAYGLRTLPSGLQARVQPDGGIRLTRSLDGGDRRHEHLAAMNATLNKPEDSPVELAHLWYSHREDDESRIRIDHIVEIMRFRALLFIAILDLCADSSVLMQEHFNRVMVRMI